MGPAPKATNAFGDEVKVVASAYINIEILVVPCVVDAECMTARRNRKRNLVAEQKFAHEFTIKKNHDLSCLDVFGRITRDGNSTVSFLYSFLGQRFVLTVSLRPPLQPRMLASDAACRAC
jgi:hypothetical protein